MAVPPCVSPWSHLCVERACFLWPRLSHRAASQKPMITSQDLVGLNRTWTEMGLLWWLSILSPNPSCSEWTLVRHSTKDLPPAILPAKDLVFITRQCIFQSSSHSSVSSISVGNHSGFSESRAIYIPQSCHHQEHFSFYASWNST